MDKTKKLLNEIEAELFGSLNYHAQIKYDLKKELNDHIDEYLLFSYIYEMGRIDSVEVLIKKIQKYGEVNNGC